MIKTSNLLHSIRYIYFWFLFNFIIYWHFVVLVPDVQFLYIPPFFLLIFDLIVYRTFYLQLLNYFLLHFRFLHHLSLFPVSHFDHCTSVVCNTTIILTPQFVPNTSAAQFVLYISVCFQHLSWLTRSSVCSQKYILSRNIQMLTVPTLFTALCWFKRAQPYFQRFTSFTELPIVYKILVCSWLLSLFSCLLFLAVQFVYRVVPTAAYGPHSARCTVLCDPQEPLKRQKIKTFTWIEAFFSNFIRCGSLIIDYPVLQPSYQNVSQPLL